MTPTRIRRHRTLLAAVLVLAIGVGRLYRAITRTRTIPLSPLTGRWRIGADYLDRHAIPTTGERTGQLEDLDRYARPEFDPTTIDPRVCHFYEHTGEYVLAYDVTWHRGFRVGAALASRLTTRIGQLNLPGPYDCTSSPRTLRSRFVGIDAAADPRDGARAWIRTDSTTDETVFVAIYASHRSRGERYVNIAAPLPGANLSTVLHVDALDAYSHTGLTLTTRTTTGDEGLYLVTPLGTLPLPIDQTFRVRAADAAGVPRAGTGRDAAIVATHEMWLCGRQFLTVDYVGWRPER